VDQLTSLTDHTHTAGRPQWTSLHHSQTTHIQLIDPSGPAYITHRPHAQLVEDVR